jgi:hypothetical protein
MGAGPIEWGSMVKKLRQFGFDGPFQRGKHPFMKRGSFKLPIPKDHGSAISGPLVDRVIKRAGISLDEWDQV